MNSVVLVFSTAPAAAGDDIAERIARTLIDEQLAACVNVHAPMVSIYRWKGAVERESERQLVIKRRAPRCLRSRKGFESSTRTSCRSSSSWRRRGEARSISSG